MKIASTALLERKVAYDSWATIAQIQEQDLAKSCDKVIIDDYSLILDYVNQREKGVLVTSLHMSDYLRVLLKLSRGMSGNRRVNILRRKQASAQEKQLFRRFETATSVRVLRTGNGSDSESESGRKCVFKAVRALKNKEILIALCDLSCRWGNTARVNFLSHPMNLVRGPAELAILAEADLLMILCHKEEGVQKALACPIIRTSDTRLSVDQHTALITGVLAQYASHQIRRFPEQWQNWHLIPEMLAQTPNMPEQK